MKKFLFALFFTLLKHNTTAQNTAVNFIANDCNGVSHELFTELDSGNVIVLVWVMPCGSCINPAIMAYSLVSTYSSSAAGKVLFYMADDYSDSDCNTIKNWANLYNLSSNTTFFSDPKIKMSDYGKDGMPKGVVLGGTIHAVYFNEDDVFSSANLKNAIDSALAANVATVSTTGAAEYFRHSFKTEVFPNPSGGAVNIFFQLEAAENIKIEIYDSAGQLMGVGQFTAMAGRNNYTLKMNEEPNPGIYFIKSYAGAKINRTRFVVAP